MDFFCFIAKLLKSSDASEHYDSNVLVCICRGLQELNVSHNRMTEVQNLVEFYPALQVLEMSENCVEAWEQVVSVECS